MPLRNDFEFDLRDTRSGHSKRFCGYIGNVDDSSGNEWTTIIDPNSHGPPISHVRNSHLCAEWQRAMSSGQSVPINLFTGRCF